jgi:formylaminopyrimidine deformylase / aminopyrimidine aminohydrolase
VDVGWLLERYAGRWSRATHHPVLVAVREGELAPAAFDTWLAQDYRFVEALLGFQARLLGRAPRYAQAVLADGVVALVEELSWFEHLAAARDIDLTVAPRAGTIAYCQLLDELDNAEFQVALTMLWAIERTYLDAWSFAAPGAPAYRTVVDHWTTPEFAAYVDALAVAATHARPDEVAVDHYLPRVIDAEIAFWDMAWESP